MEIEEVLKRWGLLAVFVGAATEGEVTMLLAGVMAHVGFVDLVSAIGHYAAGEVARPRRRKSFGGPLLYREQLRRGLAE